MSRTGPEPKPPWQAVPPAVKAAAERVLGARVARAERVYGGYAPSATFRIRLADGRRAFFKGVSRDSNEFMREGLALEERIYRELGSLIRPWAPELFDAFRVDDWHVLLLEDVGPADVPPWTLGKVRRAMRDFASFHEASLGMALPGWLPDRIDEVDVWDRLIESGGLDGLAVLAGSEADAARRWLASYVGALREASARLRRAAARRAFLHLDVRSDNVRTRPRLRLFDWNWATPGPPELDVGYFAETITVEDGPAPEVAVSFYEEVAPLDRDLLGAAAAGIAGVMAGSAQRPPNPQLPRVRSLQRRQLKVCLGWSARLLGLPEPGWAGAIPS